MGSCLPCLREETIWIAPLLSNLCGCNCKIAQTPSLGILTVINNMSGVCQVFVFLSLVSVFCLLKPLWVLFSAHGAPRELEVLPCCSRHYLEKCVFSLHFQIRHSFLFRCVCSLYGGTTSSVVCWYLNDSVCLNICNKCGWLEEDFSRSEQATHPLLSWCCCREKSC